MVNFWIQKKLELEGHHNEEYILHAWAREFQLGLSEMVGSVGHYGGGGGRG